MIRKLRAFGRILRILGFLSWFTLRMRSRRPDAGSDAREQWRRAYFQGACRGILERLELEVVVRGRFPTEGGILVSNHLGYLDVLVLASLGPTVFVSRADVERWPVIGRLTRWCSTIYIDRSRKDQIPAVIEEMKSALRTGSQVVFFPESTSGPGDEVMPFRASLFDVATRAATPVRVCALSYQTPEGEPTARDAVCWWGDAGFSPHLFRMAGLSRITASVVFPETVFRSDDRKELARICHEAVTEAFIPVTGSEAAG